MSVDRAVFDINFFGPVSLTKLVIKQFLQQGRGHIVVVSSIDGKFGKLHPLPNRDLVIFNKYSYYMLFNQYWPVSDSDVYFMFKEYDKKNFPLREFLVYLESSPQELKIFVPHDLKQEKITNNRCNFSLILYYDRFNFKSLQFLQQNIIIFTI